jgi:hypothetical protein
MNQFSIKGHPSCIWSASQQTPSSPLGPPPAQASCSPPPDDSSLLEQPLNATDIENANIIAASSVLNLELFIIVTPYAYYFVTHECFLIRANIITIVILSQYPALRNIT